MADEAHQGRAEEERRQRRRRGSDDLAAAQRLPIPPEVQARLDQQGLVPRWVNDEGNRIVQLTTQDDYDPVEGVEPVPVGTDPRTGQPIKAHLLAKPREFIEEDRRKKDERRRAVEDAMVRTPDAAPGVGGNPHPATAPTYVAKGSSITRGNQILE